MAYVDPIDFTATTVSVAQGNQHWRDNVRALNSIPAVRVHHNADQAISSGAAWSLLAFNSERYDPVLMHGTPNTSLFCKTAGKYDIYGNIAWSGDATGVRGLRIVVNSSVIVAQVNVTGLASGNAMMVHTPGPWQLAVNDEVTLQVTQDSGSTLNVLAVASYSPEFGMQRTSE